MVIKRSFKYIYRLGANHKFRQAISIVYDLQEKMTLNV